MEAFGCGGAGGGTDVLPSGTVSGGGEKVSVHEGSMELYLCCTMH